VSRPAAACAQERIGGGSFVLARRCIILATIATFAALPAAGAAQTLSAEGAPIVPVATEADYARLVRTTVDGYVIPSYRTLADVTAELAERVEGMCTEPGDANRDAVDDAFAATLVGWAGVDFLRFGPMAREGRYERFAFWPDPHGTGERQLRQLLARQDQALTEPGALAAQSAAVQGLPALERLLYSGKSALLGDGAPDAFRCGLAGAVTENMATLASEALAGWEGTDGWAALVNNPAAGNPVYRTHAEAAREVLKAILTGLEQLRDQRLLPAVGATPEQAKASRAPYHRSGQTLAYLAASSGALQGLVAASGFLELLPADQAGYASSARFEFKNLDAALAAAGPDIEVALGDREKRGKLVYAAIVLKSLRDLFERHIAVGAGLSPGFNSLDGD
jgi:predicted lipoprotein